MSSTGHGLLRSALIDTGATISLFDEYIARRLGIDLTDSPGINISGVGGLVREAKVAPVTLRLLDSLQLEVSVEVAFAPDVEIVLRNLIGLDVLESFTLALTHRQRTGYLQRANP